MQVVGRGAILGELALVTNAARSASVRALRDSEVVEVTRAAFGDLVEGNAEFAMALVRLLGDKLQLTEGLSRVRLATPTVVVLVAAATSTWRRSAVESLESSVRRCAPWHWTIPEATTQPRGRARQGRTAQRSRGAQRDRHLDRMGPLLLRQADRAAVLVDAGSLVDAPHWPTASPLCDLVTIGAANAREIASWNSLFHVVPATWWPLVTVSPKAQPGSPAAW